MLKHGHYGIDMILITQPPSGGCVLKHYGGQRETMLVEPAAFRRLCVETPLGLTGLSDLPPAAFRRLCVETVDSGLKQAFFTPAAFRRLCVETSPDWGMAGYYAPSRLQAAVC